MVLKYDVVYEDANCARRFELKMKEVAIGLNHRVGRKRRSQKEGTAIARTNKM